MRKNVKASKRKKKKNFVEFRNHSSKADEKPNQKTFPSQQANDETSEISLISSLNGDSLKCFPSTASEDC